MQNSGFKTKILTAIAFGLVSQYSLAALPDTLKLDYAYYAPTSLVVKEQKLLEKALPNTQIKWVFSQGSNRSLEYLNSGSVDFSSTAGLAAVLSRANGSPIKTVYIQSQPEWTALLVAKNSPIKSLKDLKGKKIAATKGTDPFLFTLQALETAGLNKKDVQLVHLQHPDGKTALERGQVDAWAGLDPLMASAQVQSGAKLLYRNVGFNSYSVLSTKEQFASQSPEAIEAVIKAYEQARKWAKANPAKLAELLARESKLPIAVAKLQLSRTNFEQNIPTVKHINALKKSGTILTEEDLVRKGTNVNQVIDQLFDAKYANKVVKK
ncbi:aliphatic sulfonate ABC transporter substrate-binding protein [Acinetobacter kookii]|jgi:sulfonate transport system substrate-binding protein|uniref:aliphatic sulfonate ABC transporter substrate-binding protein n=1 Tax=unclassified Acinetobacter TaxID=196816 RepID=UPI0021B7710D|nr:MULTISPECIES: aliphatic sulfonate ABC transporter substrate-binding protein [unclassified Acinetobacter]MCT8088366.1 aliphatic sulfonate ABC transporter substrate-binding protein [Acinetobacter sp. F_3_1]MCT8097736.1 aliphatic sulfonate ABC transporter substrate-binding protein [Acinetobacter sp. C_3_1]MCT8100392.1 aliphatic sulfonate ABC transporter substrate-binding protein [Acinetobacter sp. C_4_1]MCT8133888.1 aliphatic sulfonate ABC transporter substrate-binding protein [Acinetobacter sp